MPNDNECHEEVSRRGELQPCDKTAVAVRLDPTFGTPYPVCAFHARAVMVPLAEHDRGVAAKAWLVGHAAGRDYQGDGWNCDAHDPDEDNPYRGTPEQEEKNKAGIDEAEVERIAQAATAHNSGQTVYEVSRPSGILRVVMSSWPRAKEAYTALAGAGYRVAQDGNNVMVLAAPTESEGTP